MGATCKQVFLTLQVTKAPWLTCQLSLSLFVLFRQPLGKFALFRSLAPPGKFHHHPLTTLIGSLAETRELSMVGRGEGSEENLQERNDKRGLPLKIQRGEWLTSIPKHVACQKVNSE